MKPVVTTTADVPVIARPAVDPRFIASLAAVYIVWSSTYLAMRVAVETMPPLLMGCMRFVAAGAVMLAIAIRRGAKWPSAREWLRVTPIGALLFVGGNAFVAIAETSISSGGAAVVCATMPLWIGVLGIMFGERPTAREWVTLVVGFVGVFILMRGPSLEGRPEHIALVIASPICWALGSQLSRRTKDIGGAHATLVGPALQMLTGGIVLLVVGLASGERLPMHASANSWLALAYLWVFGSLVAFTAYAWLLRNARPVVATSYAYINPILAVLLGAALYGEPLGWTTLVANILIVGAVMLALMRPRLAKPLPAQAELGHARAERVRMNVE
jgi:drug/metabolite transporter (DMT)-like permease